ncbi:MAG TPA: MmgE/PrpD family protein [Chloroflexota bacterium]|nr:MmgE/PrpD family protein [Chloroflexota bacterium]
MDATQQHLAAYCAASGFACLTPETVHRYQRHLLDALGCALGAGDAPPCAIARRVAAAVQGTPPARVIGVATPTSLEMAAFASGVQIRYLDFNDQLVSGHPSDGLGALLGIADALALDGPALIGGMHVLYEVYGRLQAAALLRERGWDQGTFMALAVACAAGKLLGLDEVALAEAIALAASDNAATRQTRAGELSDWKGCATANAARNGVFAALLAREGLTGPARPFEGRHGLWEQVSGPFTLDLPAPGERPLIAEAGLKYFPVENNAQGPAWAALAVREALPADALASVAVETTEFTWTEIGRDPEKWAPTRRETADHSLPYIFATVLRHGTIGPEHFAPTHLADPWVRAMMPRITVAPNPAYTARWPAENLCRVTARTRDGREHVVEIAQPRGHPANPLTDAEVAAKFTRQAAPVLGAGGAEAVVDYVWALSTQPRVPALLDLLTP